MSPEPSSPGEPEPISPEPSSPEESSAPEPDKYSSPEPEANSWPEPTSIVGAVDDAKLGAEVGAEVGAGVGAEVGAGVGAEVSVVSLMELGEIGATQVALMHLGAHAKPSPSGRFPTQYAFCSWWNEKTVGGAPLSQPPKVNLSIVVSQRTQLEDSW